jgi:hypothetical protein
MSAILTFVSFPLMGKVGRSTASGRNGCGTAGAHGKPGLDLSARVPDWRLRRRTPSVRFADTFPIKGKDELHRAFVFSGEHTS